jgi:predicted anti-sigma-YlaC factor YlaD
MHDEFTLLMSMALDNEASAEEVARLHAHLAGCAACRGVWGRWQEMDRRMLAAPRLTAPAGMAEQVAARLVERELQRRRVRWAASGLALGWLTLLALVALGATGVFAWLSGNLETVGAAASTAALALTAVNGLLRGVAAAADSVGAPRLAALAGGLACLMCVLSMTWLWLVGQRHRFASAAAQGRLT